MKRGRDSWTTRLGSAELQAVHEWIDSDAGYPAADIYDALNLRRYCAKRTFRQYVAARRRRTRARQPEGTLPPSGFDTTRLEELARAAIGKALITGELPAYALPKVLSSLASLGSLELRRTIYADARERLRREAEKQTRGGQKSLSREEIYDLVDQVMRGAV